MFLKFKELLIRKMESEIHIESENRRKREDLLRKKIESGLTPDEIDLREKIVLALDRHPTDHCSFVYLTLEECPTKNYKDNMIKALNLMKEITNKAKLDKIKRLFTPREYNDFLPIYVKFKQTGKCAIHGFRG